MLEWMFGRKNSRTNSNRPVAIQQFCRRARICRAREPPRKLCYNRSIFLENYSRQWTAKKYSRGCRAWFSPLAAAASSSSPFSTRPSFPFHFSRTRC